MFSHRIYCLLASTAFFLATEAAMAGCTGIPASSATLSNFQADPGSWLPKEGSGSIAADVQSLAVAASSNPDTGAAAGERYSKFGNALRTMLNSASGEQGRALGNALGTQARGCGKTPEDVEFLTALQTAVAGTSADTAYGQALNEKPTTAVGAAGTGVGGGVGGNSPSGGAYGAGTTAGNFGTPTQAQTFAAGSTGTPFGTTGTGAGSTVIVQSTGGTGTTDQ